MVVAENRSNKRKLWLFNILPEVEMPNAEQGRENGSADVSNVVMREVNV